MQKWTTDDIPSLEGKNAIVTGTGGLGLEDAIALSKAGAKVIIAGRNPKKGQSAIASIRQQVPGADVSFELLDLADLQSIAAFAERISGQIDKLDILINNAGIMTPPRRLTTNDNFELQFGTNYLGHFALTARLLPLIKKAKGRVVSLSSVAARNGEINFDDLQAKNKYIPMPAYAQSKLACLTFAFELQKQSDINGWGISSIAAHPGISRTELFEDKRSLIGRARKYAWFIFQPAARGALTTLYAATSPQAQPGKYYGPHAFHEIRGYPREAFVPQNALDSAASNRLWKVSEQLTDIKFE